MRKQPQTLITLALSAAMVVVVISSALSRPARYQTLAGSQAISYRIDINHADRDTLCLLPGVGPGIARRILEDLAINGPFEKPSDLERVKGIAAKTRQAIEPWVKFE